MGNRSITRFALVGAMALAMVGATGCNTDQTPVSSNGEIIAAKGATVSTAQSIGVAMNGVPTDVVIDATTTWTFDRSCAMDKFEVTAGTDEATTNAAFELAVNMNKCAFFNGGTLVAVTKTSGRKSVTVSPKAGMAEVAPHTCWTGEVGNGTQADVTLSPDIAGESVVVRNSGPYTKKFSFSLLNDSNLTRVVNVSYSLQKWDGTTWNEISSNTVGDVTNVEQGTFSAMYIANGGTFGAAVSSLISGATQGDIMDNAGGISGDDFAGNNSTVVNSGSNAAVAHGPSWTVTMSEAGNYRMVVSGTVKGNDGIATQTFSASSSLVLDIGAPNCN